MSISTVFAPAKAEFEALAEKLEAAFEEIVHPHDAVADTTSTPTVAEVEAPAVDATPTVETPAA